MLLCIFFLYQLAIAIYLDERLTRLFCTDEGAVARRPKPRGMQ